MGTFKNLKAGMMVEVDRRKLFLGASDWAKAEFVGWKTYTGDFVAGCVCTMIVKGTTAAPQVRAVGDGTFLVDSVFARMTSGVSQ